jgi:transcriptional regulator with XRE-family HTH domain
MPTPPLSSSAWQARQTLGARLGEIRKDAGLTGRALAQLCGWHEAKVSRIEHAKTAPSADDIRAWCEHCGAFAQVDDLIAFLRSVEGMFIEWRRMERAGLRHAQESVLPLWERTRLFRAYSSWLVPGAVQTRDYTRAALRAIAERRELPDDPVSAAHLPRSPATGGHVRGLSLSPYRETRQTRKVVRCCLARWRLGPLFSHLANGPI